MEDDEVRQNLLKVRDGSGIEVGQAIALLVDDNDLRTSWTGFSGRLGYDEARQIARIALFRAAPRFNASDPRRASGFVATAMRGGCITALDYNKRSRRRNGVVAIEHDVAAQQLRSIDLMIKKEERQQANLLRSHVRKILSPLQRDCLFYFCDGLKPRQIASMLGISYGNAHQHVKNARNTLRKIVSEFGLSAENLAEAVDVFGLLAASKKFDVQ